MMTVDYSTEEDSRLINTWLTKPILNITSQSCGSEAVQTNRSPLSNSKGNVYFVYEK